MKSDASTGQPSQTALTAAAARAAHLIVDDAPVIFADALAATLLGDRADELIAYHRAHGSHLVLATARAQAVCRSRHTEDRLAKAADRGITQYVILSAGLDSFGYRAPGYRAGGYPAQAHPPPRTGQLRVFEVDHPASQQWKRQQLAAAQIPVPASVTFVPADLEADRLASCLADAGFDFASPALVSWLGVTMYLTSEAISQTLAELARLAPGTELIADYMLPSPLRDETGDTYVELVMPVAADRGEPWRTFLAPGDMDALLTAHGFAPADHIRQRDQIGQQLWQRTDALRPAELSVIAHATRGGR